VAASPLALTSEAQPQVGITDIYAQKSPEEKLVIVRKETSAPKTLYVGDGVNDAPAMMAATVGMAIGRNSDVTAEAAGVVVMDSSHRSSQSGERRHQPGSHRRSGRAERLAGRLSSQSDS